MPEPTVITRRIGSNRGKARLWIEGPCISSHFWDQGQTFVTLWGEGTVTYCTRTHPDFDKPQRKVSGTGSRPIIDTNTDKLLTSLGVIVGDSVSITITGEKITIRKQPTNPA